MDLSAINFDKQTKLYETLSPSIFSEVWSFNKSLKYNAYDSFDTLKSISYARNGKYVEFLTQIGKDYPIVASYLQSFQNAGDLSPSMVAGFLRDYDQFDLSDPKIRLIVAVHYLTSNDQYLRHESF